MFLLFGFLAITKEFNQGRSPPQIRPGSFRAKNNLLLSTIAPKPRYIRLSAIPGKIDRTAVVSISNILMQVRGIKKGKRLAPINPIPGTVINLVADHRKRSSPTRRPAFDRSFLRVHSLDTVRETKSDHKFFGEAVRNFLAALMWLA